MVDSWVYQVGSQKNGWEASCTVFYLGQKFQVQFGSKQVGSGRVIKFFSVLPCLIRPCWVGLVGLFGLFSYFSLDCAGHHQLGLSYSFIFGLFRTHFTPQEGPFYYAQFLFITLLLKRVCGLTLGYIFYFREILFLLGPLFGLCLCVFFFFGLLKYDPIAFSLPVP